MSAAAVLAPKRPAWLKSSAVAAVALMAIYLGIAWSHPWQPGRFWGLTYGTIAALLFLNAGLYPLRRRLGARPLANVQQWLQLHVYGTTIAMLLVLIHMGFRWPGGMFGWWLLGLSLWTTLTGMLGVALQKWVPVTLAKNLRVEALYVRIPGLIERLAADAATLASGSGDALRRVYESDVKALLAAPAPRWAYMSDVRDSRVRLLEPLTRIETFVDEADRERLRDLTTIVSEKLDLDAHMSLQRALRAWLVLHIPAAMALLGLLAVHIIAVVYL
jgi:hypothetical protein